MNNCSKCNKVIHAKNLCSYHYKKNWAEINKDHVRELYKKYRVKNREKLRKYERERNNNPKYIEIKKKANQKYSKKPEVREKRRIRDRMRWNSNPDLREYHRIYQRNNPRGNHKYSLELQIAMINVRIRDNNICQWYNCGLNHKETRIEVHHIFPRSEYPELELVEQYMICYCEKHHRLWHRRRREYEITTRFATLKIT